MTILDEKLTTATPGESRTERVEIPEKMYMLVIKFTNPDGGETIERYLADSVRGGYIDFGDRKKFAILHIYEYGLMNPKEVFDYSLSNYSGRQVKLTRIVD